MTQASKKFTIKSPLLMVLVADKQTNRIRDIHFIFRDMEIGSLALNDGSPALAEPDEGAFKSIFGGDSEDRPIRHVLTIESPLSDKKMFDLFHTLWEKAKCTNDYDKQQWNELWKLLQ